jgi:hypothetical protein
MLGPGRCPCTSVWLEFAAVGPCIRPATTTSLAVTVVLICLAGMTFVPWLQCAGHSLYMLAGRWLFRVTNVHPCFSLPLQFVLDAGCVRAGPGMHYETAEQKGMTPS